LHTGGVSKMAEEIFRFEDFELDRGASQLRRAGTGVHLQRIPFQLLSLLVERRGQLVTQEEILEHIWGKGVFVDSENAIRTAVRKIRRALNDDADAPRFIITVPARGYRFAAQIDHMNGTPAETDGIATVAESSPSTSISAVSSAAPSDEKPGPRQWPWRVAAIAVGFALSSALVVLALHLSLRPPTPPGSIPLAQPPALPLPDKLSIAVLPFADMSGDRDQDYFSDGITDDLITDLSRVPGLFVIARSSTFTYKGKAAKVQDVGRELGVMYVLEGSVQKSANQLRITAQLVDTAGGNHLWAERFDRPLKDIFALQDEIVRKIVTTLKLQLTVEEQGFVARKNTDNLEAYDYFLRGQEYALSLTKEGNAQARQLWEKAVALDPEYAEAYAQLGRTYFFEWYYHWSADPQALKRAFELVRKALALDDSLPLAHSRLSHLYMVQQQYDEAIAEGERAIALDPNNANSYAVQASVLNAAGRPEEAVQALAQAMRLNPRYPAMYLEQFGSAYYQMGRYAEAIGALKEAERRMPTASDVQTTLTASYLGQWLSQEGPAAQTLEQAFTAAQRAVALNDWYQSRVILGDVYLYRQQYNQALAEMKRAVAVAPAEAYGYAALAMVLSYMGRSEEALEAAAQAHQLEARSTRPPENLLARVGFAYAMAGRYNEARGPLQRSLRRLPNRLDIHLMLAVVYSELGQAAEARTEAAEVLRLNPHFSLAVNKQRMPIKDPAVLEHYLAALHQAGLK
jgi:TolB-like protein/DNA-binding winged helix-turn-helix (wHTH) protein/predicted Zn-dependent protease